MVFSSLLARDSRTGFYPRQVLTGGLVLAVLLAMALSVAAAPRDFNIRDYGAAGDGKALDTASINKAIAACTAAGGGRVVFPSGVFLSGTVLLKSGVTLYFAEGSTLKGTPDLTQYKSYSALAGSPEARFRNNWHRALILGIEARNVAITGPGVIDGNKVYDPAGEEKMRGPHAIILGGCRGVAIHDANIRDAANYAILMECSDEVTVERVAITGGWDGVHFRGWVSQPCHNLRIRDCRFETGDDSIAGRYVENLDIQNCSINSSCNGIRIIGPVKNMAVRNCGFDGPGRQPHRSSKRTNMLAGIILQPGGWDASPGAMEDVTISSVSMKEVAAPVTIVMKRPGNTMDRITIDHLAATGVYRAPLSVESWSTVPVGSVTFRDVDVEYEGGGTAEQARMKVRAPGVDPRPLPAWGFYARNAGRITLDHVRLRSAKPDLRPVLIAEGVKELELGKLDYPKVAGAEEPLKITSGTQVRRH